LRKRAKFIYLISPNKINSNFYRELKEVLKTNKVKFFQLRLKKISNNILNNHYLNKDEINIYLFNGEIIVD